MIVIGIDGGLKGGIVALYGHSVQRWVMPTVGTGQRVYDLRALTLILSCCCSHDSPRPFAFIERAQAMPKQGVSSSFKIGFGFGALQGVVTALDIPYEVVSPQTWQRTMFEGINRSDTKAASVLVAQRQQPTIDWRATPRCKNAHDGLTDAYCIAAWGMRQLAARQLQEGTAAE